MARRTPIEDAIRAALAPRRPQSYCFGVPFEAASTEEIIAAQVRDQCGFKYRWPVLQDPIFTPLFTALFSTTFLGGAATWTLFGGAISLASVASAIAVTALTIGLQYAMMPKPPKPEDGRAPLTQPLPYRFFGVGKCRVAGAFMLWEAVDGNLYSVQAIMAHPIDAYVDFYLNDDRVTLGGAGNDEVQAIGDRYANAVVKVWKRLGAVPETAYGDIVAQLGGQGIWTNDHRGDGQASLGMLCRTPKAENFTARFPYGKPALSAVGQWAKVWDFRDEDQDPEDEETWTWSDNSVLILAWHLCFNPFGERRDFRKAILPVFDMWQEEADVCDEGVALAIGGTEKRYTCGGFDTTEHGPKSATNAILATMDGWMCTRGDGAVLIVAGKFREKYCTTLTDADIIGYVTQHDVLFDDEINQLTPVFNYPATDYSSTNTDFFEDTAAQIEAGRALPEEGHYDWCTQWRQARRLGKRDWQRIRQKKQGQIFANLSGINAVYKPWTRLQTPVMIPGLNGKVIANRKATFDLMNGGFRIDYAKMPDNPADIDIWVPASDEGAAPPVPIKPVSDGIPTPIIDTVTVIASGGSVYLRVALVDPIRDDLTPRIEYRIHDIGGGTPGNWISQNFSDATPSGGLILLNTNPVPGDQNLDVRASYIGANGKPGPDTTPVNITSTVDNTPPDDLISFGAGNGAGQFTVSFGTENDPHLATVAIYRVPHAVVLNRATHLVSQPAVSPGISYMIPVTSTAGSWDIYAEPKNRSGIAGSLEGPVAVTVS